MCVAFVDLDLFRRAAAGICLVDGGDDRRLQRLAISGVAIDRDVRGDRRFDRLAEAVLAADPSNPVIDAAFINQRQ
jgi:hypothetical protein